METKNTTPTRKPVAVLRCCYLGHSDQPKTEWPEGRINAIAWYEPAIRASIAYCDKRAAHFRAHLASFPRAGWRVKDASNRYQAAADRLRAFLDSRLETAFDEFTEGLAYLHELGQPDPIPCPGCPVHDGANRDADCDCSECPHCERWLLCATCDVCPTCSPTGHGTFEFAGVAA